MKSGLKKKHRHRFAPRWTQGYPFTWLGLGTALALYRRSQRTDRLATKRRGTGDAPIAPITPR